MSNPLSLDFDSTLRHQACQASVIMAKHANYYSSFSKLKKPYCEMMVTLIMLDIKTAENTPTVQPSESIHSPFNEEEYKLLENVFAQVDKLVKSHYDDGIFGSFYSSVINLSNRLKMFPANKEF